MDKVKNELLQGTLDLLILRTLSAASLHGWDIAKRIAIVSRDRLSLKQGSLYPALHRMGRLRSRPQREVLPPHPCWSDPAGGREGALAVLRFRHEQRPRHGRGGAR